MEIISFSCPKCGKRLAKRAQFATTDTACPCCSHIFLCAAGVDVRFQDYDSVHLSTKESIVAAPGEKPPSRRMPKVESQEVIEELPPPPPTIKTKSTAGTVIWYMVGAVIGIVASLHIVEKYINEPRRRAEYYAPVEIIDQCYREAEAAAIEEIRMQSLRDVPQDEMQRYIDEKFQIIYAIQTIRYRRSQGYCTIDDWMKRRREKSVYEN